MFNGEWCSPRYRVAARAALVLQCAVAAISLLVLDLGQTAKLCGVVILGFWIAAFLIAARRPWTPTRGDLWFWRWGFLPAFVLAVVVAAWMR